jgi:hypothetical protein
MGEEGIARGSEELKQLEQDVMIMHMDAREEREDTSVLAKSIMDRRE